MPAGELASSLEVEMSGCPFCRELVERNPVAIFRADFGGRLTYLNHIGRMRSGLGQQRIEGIPLRQMVLPEDEAVFDAALLRIVDGDTRPVECRLRTDRGEIRHVRVSCWLERDDRERPRAISGAVVDISERKAMEESLKASECRFRLMTENAKDIICTLDLGFVITYITPAVRQVLGFAPEEMIGQRVDEFVERESRRLITDDLAEAFGVEGTPQKDALRGGTLVVPFADVRGTMRWLEIKRSFLRDEEGKPDGVGVIGRDITERKRSEEALKMSERRFRNVFRALPMGVAFLHPDGEIVEVNPALGRLLGISGVRLCGESLLRHVIPEDQDLCARLWRSPQTDAADGNQCRVRFRHAGGDVVSCMLTCQCVGIEDGRPRSLMVVAEP